MKHLIQLMPWLEETARRVVIIPHQQPDADAFGSGLALWHWLRAKGHTVAVVSPTDFPRFLEWMPGCSQILSFPKQPEAVKTAFAEAELFVCVDFSARNRMKPLHKVLDQYPDTPIALIDHHRGKEDFADYEFWDIEAAATAQLVYDFLGMVEQQAYITPEIASLLYAGILTDTGSFKHGNTTPHVHRVVADLMERGADAGHIHRLIFDNGREQRLRFLGYALWQKLTVLPQYHTAFFAISADDLKKFSSQNGDTEGLVNYALSIEGIYLAATFIEKDDNEIKISLRSVGDFSVADMATQHFEGGGHKNAAGGERKGASLQQVVDQFTQLLPGCEAALEQVHRQESS
ncbi:MAG: bifunctional oligoribonuclease/PAP phosphatase NrnA [Bernardetiaceae bacterium]